MCFLNRFVEGFEILHGDHHGLSDTIGFLDSLATLAKIGGHHQEREHLAAAALFNWEVCSIIGFNEVCVSLRNL